ncbi:hypothetical protein R5R35_000814 [Gryllus longicercus]|uniref:Origin recognition complex subunit 5 n=1 Tax=Gryllus longicercus TaxID=2509291 RepID=A0AAN9ZAP9_9ORTH
MCQVRSDDIQQSASAAPTIPSDGNCGGSCNIFLSPSFTEPYFVDEESVSVKSESPQITLSPTTAPPCSPFLQTVSVISTFVIARKEDTAPAQVISPMIVSEEMLDTNMISNTPIYDIGQFQHSDSSDPVFHISVLEQVGIGVGVCFAMCLIVLCIMTCRRRSGAAVLTQPVNDVLTKPRCPAVLQEECPPISWKEEPFKRRGPVVLAADMLHWEHEQVNSIFPDPHFRVDEQVDTESTATEEMTTSLRALEFVCEDEAEWQKQLSQDVICRSEPIERLIELLGRPKNVVPESIFLYGLHASGKTYVTSRLLNVLGYRHVFVDCVKCYHPKIFYGSILKGLTDQDKEPQKMCDSMYEFINQFTAALSTSYFEKNAFIVVLDNCEKLRSMESHLLPAFLRLQELTGKNVCCVLISTLPWEKFLSPSGLVDPFEVFFPQYTKDEILKIVCHNCVWGGDLDAIFVQYVRLFLGVFYICCRDVLEVQHMVRSHFLEHCEPIISGRVEPSRLWSILLPHFRTLGSQLYLRMIPNTAADGTVVQKNSTCPSRWALSFELPYYSKFFLIAAFLASYSPQRLDKALFVKKNEKRGRRGKKKTRSHDDVVADMLLGPKAFTVGRLLAIFYSIVDSEVNFTASVSAQISSLVKLQLLTVNDSSLDAQMLKCCVGLDFITTIAKTVDFDIIKYLFPPK